MYLYEKQKDKVCVYTLNPNMDKVQQFRKVYMNRMPKEDRVLQAVCRKNFVLNNGELFNLNGYTNDFVMNVAFDKLCQNSCWLIDRYHCVSRYMGNDDEIKSSKELVETYCNGDINPLRMVVVTNGITNDFIKGLLITEDYHSLNKQENMMSNIIALPMELFSLEWFMFGGRIDAINDYEFARLMSVFDFSINPVATFSYEELMNGINYGIIDDDIKRIIAQVEDYSLKTEKTLTRVRKYR